MQKDNFSFHNGMILGGLCSIPFTLFIASIAATLFYWILNNLTNLLWWL